MSVRILSNQGCEDSGRIDPASKGICSPSRRRRQSETRWESQQFNLENLESRILLSVTLNADGWTVVGESVDTRVIYVSSSSGNDNNDGLSQSSAVKTLDKAEDLVRDGKPDWILLKSGDVWYEGFESWQKSGRSASERMVISSYGSGDRPELRTGTDKGISGKYEQDVSNIAIIGLHFNAHTRETDSGSFVSTSGDNGIRWLSDGQNLLIENNIIENYTSNVVIQSSHGYSNVELRRNVITDAYDTTGHSQGLFTKNITNVRLEGNVFDHNGWNENYSGTRTQFNHNAYIQIDTEGLIATHNLFLRGSSHGLQARNGGIVTNNVFAYNALGLSFGYVLGGATNDAPPGGVVGRVSDNVFLHGQDIGDSPRGIALELGNIQEARIYNNVFAHSGGQETSTIAIQVDSENLEGISELDIQGNIVYNWYRGIKFDGGDKTAGNVNISNNQFHDTESDLPLIDLNVTNLPSALSFSDNRYYHTKSTKPFRTDNGRMTYSDWLNYSGESGASWGQSTAPHPNRDIEDYDLFAGGLGTLNNFYDNVREFGYLEAGTNYTAAAMINYIQSGYIEGITENPASKPGGGDDGDDTPKGGGDDVSTQGGNADYIDALAELTDAFNEGDSITNWHIGTIRDRSSGRLDVSGSVAAAYDFDLANNSNVNMLVKFLGEDGAALLMNKDFESVVAFERNSDGDFAYEGGLSKGTYHLVIFNSDADLEEVRFRTLADSDSSASTPSVLANPLGGTTGGSTNEDPTDSGSGSGGTDTGNNDTPVSLVAEKDLGEFTRKRWTNGGLEGDDKSDIYVFKLGRDGDVEVLLKYLRDDADIRLYDADGNLIDTSSNNGDSDERITASLTKDTYYVEVFSDESWVDTSYGLGILVS